jgi:DNA-binding transcriptional MerR regulator
MSYTVRKLAKLAGVSVRTLHYYDEVGLLKPSFIKENGYRVYEEKELYTLQQILFFRELEFSLEQIKEIMNAPKFDPLKALREQKKLLRLRKERLNKLIETIDKTIISQRGGEDMTNDDLFNSFSREQIEEYKTEAKERWGQTKAYKQSIERMRSWTSDDYKRVAQEGQDITASIAKVSDFGIESPEVQTQVKRHFEYINEFYDCTAQMYRGLGRMYTEDPRFSAYYEKFKPGLAKFMSEAINHFADRLPD